MSDSNNKDDINENNKIPEPVADEAAEALKSPGDTEDKSSQKPSVEVGEKSSEAGDKSSSVETGSVSAKKEKRRIADKRAKSLRVFSIGSVLIAIAIVIVINLIFDSALGQRLSWDMTATKYNSIGDSSVEILSGLEKDVEIVALAEETMYASSSDIAMMLNDYEKHGNGRISVRYVDLQTSPLIKSELDPNEILEVRAGDFIVKSGDKVRGISYATLFNVDSNTGGIISNSIEASFTSAIASVTSDVMNKAYFVTSHDEGTSEQLASLLMFRNFETADLDLVATGAIPEDCDLLIFNAPQTDISVDEEALLTEYVRQNGGKVIVITGFTTEGAPRLERLNNVMHIFNLDISDQLILEADPNYLWAMSPTSSYMDIASSYVSRSSRGMAYNIRAIMDFNNPKEYITTTVLMTTSENAVVVLDQQAEETSAPAKFTGAMLSVYNGSANESRAAVFGTMSVANDAFIQQYTTDNASTQLLLKVASEMVGDDSAVSIGVKTYPSRMLTRPPTTGTVTFLSVFSLVIIPLALIVAAIIIYNRRKKL